MINQIMNKIKLSEIFFLSNNFLSSMNFNLYSLVIINNFHFSPFITKNNINIFKSHFNFFFSNILFHNLIFQTNFVQINFKNFLTRVLTFENIIYENLILNISLIPQEEVLINFCIFQNIFSNQNGGGLYFSILNQNIIIKNTIFMNCITTAEYSGGFFLNNGIANLLNLCIIDCKAQHSHAFRISTQNSISNNILVHYCPKYPIGGMGTFWINSKISEFNYLNSSNNILAGHASGFLFQYCPNTKIQFITIFNCTAMAVAEIDYSNNGIINYCNLISNLETRDGLLSVSYSSPVLYNNSIFKQNNGDLVFYYLSGLIQFSNCVFDIGIDIKASYLENNINFHTNITFNNFILLNYFQCSNFIFINSTNLNIINNQFIYVNFYFIIFILN